MRLTIPWCMKDEMVETEIEIRPELFDVLLWVARDKPATVSDVFDGCGQTLHLAWVVDTGLGFSWQREGGPDLLILHCPVAISVVGHLDLDRLVQLVPTPRIILPGCRTPRVPNAWATIPGW